MEGQEVLSRILAATEPGKQLWVRPKLEISDSQKGFSAWIQRSVYIDQTTRLKQDSKDYRGKGKNKKGNVEQKTKQYGKSLVKFPRSSRARSGELLRHYSTGIAAQCLSAYKPRFPLGHLHLVSRDHRFPGMMVLRLRVGTVDA